MSLEEVTKALDYMISNADKIKEHVLSIKKDLSVALNPEEKEKHEDVRMKIDENLWEIYRITYTIEGDRIHMSKEARRILGYDVSDEGSDSDCDSEESDYDAEYTSDPETVIDLDEGIIPKPETEYEKYIPEM